MSVFTGVNQSYAQAWHRKLVFFGAHVCVRLVAYALVTPLMGLLINLAVSLSDQSALTDQDIAGFILTPGGFVASALVLSILMVAEVIGFALMTGIIRSGETDGWRALRGAVALIGRRSGQLLGFTLLLVLRVIAISVPFALIALLVAKRYLTDYDINYYLTNHPPDFFIAISIIVPIVLTLAIILLNRLSAWSLSLHLVLFSNVSARAAFERSATIMAGRRLRLQRDIVLWVLVRVLIGAAIAAVIGGAVGLIPVQAGSGLRVALMLMAGLVGLWLLAGLVLSAVSLGALSILLNGYFNATDAGHAASDPVPIPAQLPINSKLAFAGVAVLAVLGFWFAADLLDEVAARDEVEVIAHRGAAGSRPENTLASVEQAIVDRADWIEIDVQETADDQVVVVHDSDFMKLAGVNLKIWDATMQDLDGIDIGSWYDPMYGDQRTPLLRDVLALAKGRAKVLIELKYYGHDVDLEARVVRIVEEMGMSDQIATMSLKYPAVQKMLALEPTWRTGVLAATAIGNLAQLDGDFVAVNKSMATSHLAKATAAAGKDLYAWTINDPIEMSSMISRGVDGLITDEPELARKVLAYRAELSTPERLFLLLADILGLDMTPGTYRDNQP